LRSAWQRARQSRRRSEAARIGCAARIRGREGAQRSAREVLRHCDPIAAIASEPLVIDVTLPHDHGASERNDEIGRYPPASVARTIGRRLRMQLRPTPRFEWLAAEYTREICQGDAVQRCC